MKKSSRNIIKSFPTKIAVSAFIRNIKQPFAVDIYWRNIKSRRKLKFSKPVFHVQKHTGGAVITWHVYAPNIVGSVEKRDGFSRQSWMLYGRKNAEKAGRLLENGWVHFYIFTYTKPQTIKIMNDSCFVVKYSHPSLLHHLPTNFSKHQNFLKQIFESDTFPNQPPFFESKFPKNVNWVTMRPSTLIWCMIIR